MLLTNNFRLAASTIAAIYKERWQIELFFKLLKQHLKIRTFVGTTANAVRIQIWTALMAVLVVRAQVVYQLRQDEVFVASLCRVRSR